MSWRIEQITRSLASEALPTANEQLATVGQFLTLLDDSSEEHRRNVDEVKDLLRLDQQHRLTSAIHGFWQSVLSLKAPANVKRLVRKASKRAEAEQVELERQISSGQRQASIEQNPWLRLFREVHALPLLHGANRGELAKAFVALFNVTKLVAPSFIDTVRADAAAGGFAQLRERFVRFLRKSSDDEATVIEAPADSRSPAKLSRDEWVAISKNYPTQRAASDGTGFDPKTITKYLQQHDIPNPWKAERAA